MECTPPVPRALASMSIVYMVTEGLVVSSPRVNCCPQGGSEESGNDRRKEDVGLRDGAGLSWRRKCRWLELPTTGHRFTSAPLHDQAHHYNGRINADEMSHNHVRITPSRIAPLCQRLHALPLCAFFALLSVLLHGEKWWCQELLITRVYRSYHRLDPASTMYMYTYPCVQIVTVNANSTTGIGTPRRLICTRVKERRTGTDIWRLSDKCMSEAQKLLFVCKSVGLWMGAEQQDEREDCRKLIISLVCGMERGPPQVALER